MGEGGTQAYTKDVEESTSVRNWGVGQKGLRKEKQPQLGYRQERNPETKKKEPWTQEGNREGVTRWRREH